MERHALRQHLAACLILGALALAGLAAQRRHHEEARHHA